MGIRNGVQRKNKNPETKQRIKKKIRITKIAIAPIKIIKVDIVTTKQTLKFHKRNRNSFEMPTLSRIIIMLGINMMWIKSWKNSKNNRWPNIVLITHMRILRTIKGLNLNQELLSKVIGMLIWSKIQHP